MASIRFSRRHILGAVAALPVAGGGWAAMVLDIGKRTASGTSPGAARVKLTDFGGGPSALDNTAAMEAALASLSKQGGGVVEIGPGRHRFASAAMGFRGIALPSGITIRGVGRADTVLHVIGNAVCNFFVGLNRRDIAFEDLSLVGNNTSVTKGSVYGVGSAVRWVLTRDATSSVSGFAMRRVHLENFRAPYWVDVQNGSPPQRSLEMRSVIIEDVTFNSRPGNSINAGDLGTNSSVICINGNKGAIRNVLVSDLVGDAQYIKTGIILYHHVIGAKLDRINIKAAGLDGATDDAGAYAIQLYDTYYRMASVEVSDAVIDSPRSAGIYVAGGTDISIVNPKVSGQTDQEAGTLPKGAIAFNGTRRWSLKGGELRNNWRDLDIAAPPMGNRETPEPVGGLIEQVQAAESNNGIVIRHFAGHVAAGITVRNCQWQTSTRTVLVTNSSAPVRSGPRATGGYVNDVHFENCHFEAGPGYRAIDLYGTSGSPAGGYTISDCVLIGSNPLFAKEQTGSLKVDGCVIHDRGTSSGAAAAALIDCPNLELNDCTFESPGPNGIGVNLSGSKGSARGLKFRNCTHELQPTASPNQLGRGKPDFAGRDGQYVQNLDFPRGQYRGWICLGGTRWKGTNG